MELFSFKTKSFSTGLMNKRYWQLHLLADLYFLRYAFSSREPFFVGACSQNEQAEFLCLMKRHHTKKPRIRATTPTMTQSIQPILESVGNDRANASD